MRVGKDGLTAAEVNGYAGSIGRVVFGKALRPSATHLVPAFGLGCDVHLRIDEHCYGSALTPRTSEGVSPVDAVAAGTERTVFEDPADALRHRGNGSISAGHLEQLQALEIGIAGTTEVVGTSTYLSVLEVVETILVIRSPGVLIAIEQRVLIDGLRRIVENGEVASQCIVDTTLDGDVLEVTACSGTL